MLNKIITMLGTVNNLIELADVLNNSQDMKNHIFDSMGYIIKDLYKDYIENKYPVLEFEEANEIEERHNQMFDTIIEFTEPECDNIYYPIGIEVSISFVMDMKKAMGEKGDYVDWKGFMFG